jgi:hypothetical protein
MRRDIRDALLAEDARELPRLDQLRRSVLDREFGRAGGRRVWRALAAAWLLIALLRGLTPSPSPLDERSAALANAARAMEQDFPRLSFREIEPSRQPPIPWM